MSEWWTYRLSSFLLFSPRTYYRLFELYNAAIWPGQLAALALGLVIFALLRRGSGKASRAVAGLIALCWLWTGIAFHASRYATINFAAVYFAWAFGLEAALWIWMGLRGGLTFDRPGGFRSRAGLAMVLFAVALQPLSGPLLGRSWKSAEIFGLAPDPTAVATLGILVLARARHRWLLMVVPTIWCLVTGATLLAMKAPDAFVAPLAAAFSVGLSFRRPAEGR